MKILANDQKQGEITVKVENLNDLWTLYNVISRGDKAAGRTHRRVVLREGTKGEKKPMFLKLEVEDVSFHEFTNRLRIKGKILEGPEDLVSFGTYHTLNVEIGQRITIIKEQWLNHELKRLKEASKFESNFVMLIIAMETGLATISLVSNFSHSRIASINVNIPGKRYEQTHRNKALTEFFDNIKQVLDENVKKIEVNLIVICGPGNTRDVFIKHLKENSDNEYLKKIKSCHVSSGTESGILEVLKSNELAEIKKNVKILLETEKIEKILEYLSTDPDLIVIGFDEVSKAGERGAIGQLLIVDVLIRGTSKEQKLKIEKIITDVEYTGGEINILSSEHPTGQQLIDLGSIVGILRYKLER